MKTSRGYSLAFALIPIVYAACGSSGGGGNPPPPQGPLDNCTNPGLTSSLSSSTPFRTPTYESEIVSARDPRPASQNAYVATIQSTLASQGTPAANCIIQKRIWLYETHDGGKTWVDAPGNGNLPQGVWATDPWLSVAANGTLYLSLLTVRPALDCATPKPDPTTDQESQIQVWVLDPPETTGRTLRGPGIASTAGENRAPRGSGGLGGADDHPRIAANPMDPNQVVVTYNWAIGPTNKTDKPGDWVVTMSRSPPGPGTGIPIDAGQRFLVGAGFSFPNPLIDQNGKLWIANLQGGNHVTKYRHDQNGWVTQDSGDVGSTSTPGTETIPMGALPVDIQSEITPGIAIGQIPGQANPSIFLAYQIKDGAGVPRMELAAADTTNLHNWKFGSAPAPATNLLAEFQGAISLFAPLSTLDLVSFAATGTSWSLATPIHTVFSRFDARTLLQLHPSFTPVLAPKPLDQSPPTVGDLPSRGPTSNLVWIGEYLGITSGGRTATAAWPERAQAGSTDLAIGSAQLTCNGVVTLSAPITIAESDSVWECSNCSCGSSTPTRVVGCVAAGITGPAQICSQICSGSVCGLAASCSLGVCSAPSAPRVSDLADGVCNVLTSGLPGPRVATVSEFVATAQSGSTTHVSSSNGSGTTDMSGTVSFNTSLVPPQTGAQIELARLDIHPNDFHVGGLLGAQLQSIRVVHANRLVGQFTNATQFQIPAGVEVGVALHVQPDTILGVGPSPFDTRSVLVTTAPIKGQLDLSAGTFTLDLNASDGNGGSLVAHFQGALTQVPQSPFFTFVPPAVFLAGCGPATLSQATASSLPPGPVTITNNAPASFPLGTTLVTWTATDSQGRVATAHTTVQVIDTIRPVFGTFPSSVALTSCKPANQTVTLAIPPVSDDCGPPTVTGNVVAVDGTAHYERLGYAVSAAMVATVFLMHKINRMVTPRATQTSAAAQPNAIASEVAGASEHV